jgi:hypothetical protein
MKVIILCADSFKSWQRHKEIIDGETLMQRTVRQLRANDVTDIIITEKQDNQHPRIEGVRYIVNTLTGHDMGCIYGIKHENADLYLFGDVYFTDEALKTILQGTTNFYGWSNKRKKRRVGEIFAFKPDTKFWKYFEELWYNYKNGKVARCFSWDLYSLMQGKDFYKFGNTGDFTEIHDETEDFDTPLELTKWRKQHENIS